MGRRNYGVKRNNMIIICFRFVEIMANSPRDIVITQTNQMKASNKQYNLTVQCGYSTGNSKMRYTTQIS